MKVSCYCQVLCVFMCVVHLCSFSLSFSCLLFFLFLVSIVFVLFNDPCGLILINMMMMMMMLLLSWEWFDCTK